MLIDRRLLRLARPARARLVLVALLALLVFGLHVAQALALAAVFARLLSGRDDWGAPLLALGGALALRAGLTWLREAAAAAAAARVQERLRARLFTRLLELGPATQARGRSGDAQATLVDGVEALEPWFAHYLPAAGVALVGPPLVVAALFALDPAVGAAVGLSALLVAAAPALVERALGERGRAHWDAYRELSADFLDTLQGLTTLEVLGAAARRRAVLEQRTWGLYRATTAQMGLSLLETGLVALAADGGVALAVGVACWRAAQGALPVESVVWVLTLSAEAFRPFRLAAQHWHAGYLGVSAAPGLQALLDAPVEVLQAPDARPLRRPPSGLGVRFEGVTFTYPGRARPVLAELDFELRPGETVALVGASGAGKSTLAALLLRFLDPDRGRVLLDGQDARGLTLDSLRAAVALVAQDTYLFHGSVRDNLLAAAPDAGEERLRAACRAARAEEFIRALPGGWDARVGERGLRLSGGQRQRLAIARALLRDAPVLVLDEPTAHLDGAAEEDVLAALERLAHGRTTLLITHRVSALGRVDRVLALADGRVTPAAAGALA